jgi:mRNA interferase RelE/StbE
MMLMKSVVYTVSAAKDLRRHGNMAARVRRAVDEYAADGIAHANNVTELVGSSGKRLRIGGFRVIFDESETTLIVTKVGPRGDVYE